MEVSKKSTTPEQIRSEMITFKKQVCRFDIYPLIWNLILIYITSYALQSRYGVTYGPLTLCNLARCQPPLAQGKGWMEGYVYFM